MTKKQPRLFTVFQKNIASIKSTFGTNSPHKARLSPLKTESPVQPLVPSMLLLHRVKTSLSTLTATDPNTTPTPPPAALHSEASVQGREGEEKRRVKNSVKDRR